MKIPANATHKNLSLFGKDAKHNVCYIMGASGSGKSTIARNNRKNANIIHLDAYIDGSGAPKSIEFNAFLNKHGVDHREVSSYIKAGEWNKIDEFSDLIDRFGSYQYKKNDELYAKVFN